MTTHHAVISRLSMAALRCRGLAPQSSGITIGHITLLPHQVAAVRWLRPRLAHYGGALLADPPGLGKTYVALAIASERHHTPVIIAPPALRQRWVFAAAETGIAITFVSTERLSAPTPWHIAQPHLVIIDEAHHLRTRTTRRHQRTAALCSNATVLLLSATPIQNHVTDLEHLTHLFHLPPTRQSIAELRRLTLRRSFTELTAAYGTALASCAVPTVRARHLPPLPERHHAMQRQIADLPRLRSDTADGHALVQLGLLHALRSSDAAARRRIQRRIAVTVATEQAAAAGVQPTAHVLRAWHCHDGDVQLSMPQLLGNPSADARSRLAHLIDSARIHRHALAAMLPELDATADRQRSIVLRRLARWCTAPVVAFTQFSATATALFRLLQRETGIALLTGSGAYLTTGTISRTEALDRLLADRYRTAHDAIRLLITTDVLSEGLSLAGVGTIVHLDLPWTVARLDQRVGRAARIGAPMREIRVVPLPAPLPAPAFDLFHTLLERKRRQMAPFLDGSDEAWRTSTIATLQRLSARPEPQARHKGSADRDSRARWLTILSPDVTSRRLVAIVRIDSRRLLVVLDGQRLRAPAATDWAAIEQARITTHRARPGEIAQLRRALRAWLADRELSAVVSHAQSSRLRLRRTADEALSHANGETRHQHAAHVSLQRREGMYTRRRGSGAAASQPTAGAERKSATGIAIITGLTLVPAHR